MWCHKKKNGMVRPYPSNKVIRQNPRTGELRNIGRARARSIDYRNVFLGLKPATRYGLTKKDLAPKTDRYGKLIKVVSKQQQLHGQMMYDMHLKDDPRRAPPFTEFNQPDKKLGVVARGLSTRQLIKSRRNRERFMASPL